MLFRSDNSCLEANSLNRQVKYALGEAELAEYSPQLSQVARGQWYNLRSLVPLIDGRSRSFTRTRAPRSNDGKHRRRCGSISYASGAIDGPSTSLLPPALCADRAWSFRSRGPSTGGLDFDPCPSGYVRPFATFHALDLRDRTLQIFGLSPADQVVVQGHTDGDRRAAYGQQRPGCGRERIGFAAADVEDFVQSETSN